jgi:hypothetical protein
LPTWQPYHEPLRATLLRTGTIAVAAGAAFARSWGGLKAWPAATLLMLWPTFGGHWVEIAFLNRLRPRLPPARPAQVAARLAVWFVSGMILALGMGLTAGVLGLRPPHGSAWGPPGWVAGLAFIALELVAHAVLQILGRPSFYNGRG